MKFFVILEGPRQTGDPIESRDYKKAGSYLSAAAPLQDDRIEVEVFTTRPDTLFGATYFVLSPEHPLIQNQKSNIKNQKEVDEYFEVTRRKTELERTDMAKEKTGVRLEGIMAINPVNNEEIPVFIADYVMMNYGTGAIMAVPAHDERDGEFAKKFNLPIIEVVRPDINSQSGNDKKEADSRKQIAGLDVRDGRVVKGVKFSNLRDTCDPAERAALYEAQGADESGAAAFAGPEREQRRRFRVGDDERHALRNSEPVVFSTQTRWPGSAAIELRAWSLRTMPR